MPSTSTVLIVGSFATALAIVVFAGEVVPAVFFALVGVIAIWMRVSSARADAIIADALAPREPDAPGTQAPAEDAANGTATDTHTDTATPTATPTDEADDRPDRRRPPRAFVLG